MNLYHATVENHARYLIEDRIHPAYRVVPGAFRRRHRGLLRRDKP
jgi:hypothetical protein